MHLIQDTALGLFEARGFDSVTVEEVARAATVGVASVFRNFGTKEGLVLWDDFDPLLFEAIAARPSREPGAHAVCEATCGALGAFYAAERKRILRRSDLVAKTPALVAATRADLHALTEGLEQALTVRVRAPYRRKVIAAACVAALTVATEAWRAARARRPLSHFIRKAFKELRSLA